MILDVTVLNECLGGGVLQLLQTLALFKTKRYLFHSPETVKETLIQWILIHFLWHTEFQ